ncbi:toxin VasX [Stenotrophomonas riyadhensis]|uniref:toxin VasX n=1 Tax=Stenotrophomonas riyadhensis TaxID=2859893 RepID=UPI0033061627
MADGAAIAGSVKRSVQNTAPFGDCKKCDKAGFPILPMRFAYTPKATVAQTKAASLDGQDYSLSAGVLALRMLSQGYLYMLDERGAGTWRSFLVGVDGSLSEMPSVTTVEPSEAQCGRSDHNVRSAAFSVRDPKQAKRIWLAYFSVVQTEHQLAVYEAALLGKTMPERSSEDPEIDPAYVERRFQVYSVPDLMSAAKAGSLAHPQACLFGDGLGKLSEYAAEFTGKHQVYAESITPGADYSARASAIASRMAGMHEGGGVAVYLHDPMGIAMEIRHFASLRRLSIERINKKYSRQIAVKRLIEQIGASWKAGGADKAEEWVEDYLDKIDSSKIENFESSFKAEIGNLPALLDAHVEDCSSFANGWALQTCVRHDFDVAEPDSVLEMVCQTAAVLGGGALCDADRKNMVKEFEKPAEENLWYWVITGGQKSLLANIAENKAADVQGIIKSSYSVYQSWLDEHAAFTAQLQSRLAGGLPDPSGKPGPVRVAAYRNALATDEAIRSLITGAQGMLTDIKFAGFKNLRVFSIAGALWFRTAVQPVLEVVTVADFIRDNKESAWGHKLEARLQRSVDPEGVRRSSINLADVTDELGEAGRKKIPLLRIQWGDVIEVESLTGQQAREVSRQVNRRVRAQSKAAAAAAASRGRKFTRTPLSSSMEKIYEQLRKQGLIEQAAQRAQRELAEEAARVTAARAKNATVTAVATPAAMQSLPRATSAGWSTRAIVVLKNGGAAGSLAVWAAGFQVVALAASVKEWKEKPSATVLAKIVASFLGFTGATLEAVGAMSLLRAYFSGRAAGVFATRATAAGGILGGAAGIIAGVLTMADAADLYDQKDDDAAIRMAFAGLLLAASGGATLLGGAGSVGLVSLWGGPIVWAIIAVGAAVVGLYLLVAAEDKRDNPLQVWLRSCIFGIKPTYANEDEEVQAVEKLFVIPFAINLVWRKGKSVLGFRFGGTVDVTIDVPDVMPGQGWLSYRIVLEMSDGRILEASSNRSIGSDLREGLVDKNRISEGLEYQNRGLASPTSGGATLRNSESGGVMWRIIYVSDELKKVTVTAKMWPDKNNNADLVLPAASGMTESVVAGG